MTRSRGALLSERGHGPLPAGVTAHKLRHTFASLLDVRGEDPPYVMAQRRDLIGDAVRCGM